MFTWINIFFENGLSSNYALNIQFKCISYNSGNSMTSSAIAHYDETFNMHEHRADTTIEIQPIYGWGKKKNNKDTDKERDKRVNRMKKK